MGASANVVSRIDAAHARTCAAEHELVLLAAELDATEAWADDGAWSAAHWLSMRYGISQWKAFRIINAGRALPQLPAVSAAFASGCIGIDKVLELTRFATAENEADLLAWASGVNTAAVRRKADLWNKNTEDLQAEHARSCSWWFYDEGRRFGLEADLPASQGVVVAKALERMSAQIPVMPGEEEAFYPDERRADALFALASARVAADPDPDRATVVVHADLEGLLSGTGGCEVEGGPVIHPETARRLACNARTQTIVEDRSGHVHHVGALKREPSAWMLRQVRHRDKGCVFPACGTTRFTEAHHIRFWSNGGATDLENLALICSFHHRLVHELGWSMRRSADHQIEWHKPGGNRYRAGPRAPAVSAGVVA